jgi:NADH-quinone oxidoreductase subunit K
MSPWIAPLALAVSAVMFLTGCLGVLVRRNAIILVMSVELMMNAVNLAFVAFGERIGGMEGRAVVFFAITVAAAEAAVGLGLLIALSRLKGTVDVDRLDLLRW